MVPVGLARQLHAGPSAELAFAMGAIADVLAAHSGPAIVGDAVRMRAFDNLAQHARQVFVVVRAVDAGDVFVRGAIRIAVAVASEPIRVSPIEILGGAVGIHAGHYEQAVLVGGRGQLPEQVASIQKPRPVLQRVLAGVVGDNAAGIDDHGLNLCALPVLAPPGDVVAHRVLFGDVGLAPSIGAPIPGQFALYLPAHARGERR